MFNLLISLTFIGLSLSHSINIPRTSDPEYPLIPYPGDLDFSSASDYLDFDESDEKNVTNLSVKCSHSLTDDQGEVKSPGYPGGYPDIVICEWNITVSPNMSIYLNISGIRLRILDRIHIFDGHTKNDNLLELLNRYTYPKNVISSQNKMSIHFHSKKSYLETQTKGFALKYKAIAHGCNLRLNDSKGVIQSPGYPDSYPPNIKCDWIIRNDFNTNIIVTFNEFDLGDGLDSLEYHYYNSLSGRNIPRTLISKTNYLRLKLQSYLGQPGKGFNLTYFAKKWFPDRTFVIFASNAIINAFNDEIKTIAIKGHKMSKYIEYDEKKGTYVWFDPLSHRIYVNNKNLTTKSFAISGTPNSLALEYNLDLLFWIDIKSMTINVLSVNDSNNNIYEVFKLEDENPRDLIINMKKSLLVWSNVGIYPGIMTSCLDGSQLKTLHSNTKQAFHLTVDYQNEKYFFIDIIDHSLYSIDFNGNNEIYFLKSTEYFDSINSMFVLNNDLYLSNDMSILRIPELDLQVDKTQILYKVKKYSPNDYYFMNEAIDINRESINGFRILGEEFQLNPNSNSNNCNQNKCQYLCLPNHQSYRCLSPSIPQDLSKILNEVSNQTTNSVKTESLVVPIHDNHNSNTLSVFNTVLIVLLIISNTFIGYILFRLYYTKKVVPKRSLIRSRQPPEGTDNSILYSNLSNSVQNLLHIENISNA